MQRRIEQANGDGQTGHDLEQLDEVLALRRQELGERLAAAFLILGEDHLAHGKDAAFLEEHVLGAAEPDAFGAEGARLARIVRRVGIGADFHAAEAVGPFHQRGEIVRQIGLAHGYAAFDDLAGRAVDGDDVAFMQKHTGRLQRLALEIDMHGGGADHAGAPHAARHHRRMARHAAARGEDADGGMHALHVLRRRLDARQDHGVALRLEMHGLVGVEHDLA